MNLILLFQKDFIACDRVALDGRRMEHILKVHRARIGDTLTVGLLNSHMGKGKLVSINSRTIEMEVLLENDPPPPIPLTLVIALPRPKMLKRILQTVASLGIKNIYLINSWRVEKSFWSSPLLEPDKLEHELILGLEQAKDTIMPQIHLERLFKPFVTKELSQLVNGVTPSIVDIKRSETTSQPYGLNKPTSESKNNTRPLAITAHPKGLVKCPERVNQSTILVLGPEGGFIDIEIETLEQAGFTTVNLGDRILRLETAVPFIVSKLY